MVVWEWENEISHCRAPPRYWLEVGCGANRFRPRSQDYTYGAWDATPQTRSPLAPHLTLTACPPARPAASVARELQTAFVPLNRTHMGGTREAKY